MAIPIIVVKDEEEASNVINALQTPLIVIWAEHPLDTRCLIHLVPTSGDLLPRIRIALPHLRANGRLGEHRGFIYYAAQGMPPDRLTPASAGLLADLLSRHL